MWSLFLIELQVFRLATLLKETPTQVFSYEIYGIFKNTFFTEHLQWLLILFSNYKRLSIAVVLSFLKELR